MFPLYACEDRRLPALLDSFGIPLMFRSLHPRVCFFPPALQRVSSNVMFGGCGRGRHYTSSMAALMSG